MRKHLTTDCVVEESSSKDKYDFSFITNFITIRNGSVIQERKDLLLVRAHEALATLRCLCYCVHRTLRGRGLVEVKCNLTKRLRSLLLTPAALQVYPATLAIALRDECSPHWQEV